MNSSDSPVFLLNPANLAFLQKQAKRPVFNESKILSILALGVIAIITIIIYLSLIVPGWKNRYDLSQSGITTEGRITQFDPQEPGSDSVRIVYAFIATDGGEYQRLDWISAELFNAVMAGTQKLSVEYVPDRPTTSRLTPQTGTDLLKTATIIGGIVIAVWVIALVIGVETRDSNSQLVRQGKIIRGEIVSARAYQPERDRTADQIAQLLLKPWVYIVRRRQQSQFTVFIQYKFTSPTSGKEITKRASEIRNDLNQHSLPAPGTPVAVLYRNDRHFKIL